MRRFFFTVILFILIITSSAYGDAALYRGTGNIGALHTLDNNSIMFVPAEDVGRLLGFSSSKSGEELTLTRGSMNIKVIVNSAAAWRGMSIVPLYASPFARDGKIWIDSSSAVSLFQPSAGRDRLRISRISGYNVSSASGSEKEFGKFPDPPKPPVITAQTITPKPAPAVTLPTIPTRQTQQPTPAPAVTVQQSQPLQVPVSAASSRSSSHKKQPRMETFRPNDTSSERAESYSGVIQSVRWTLQEGTNKKIRAVIVADDTADPQVLNNRGVIHALFSSSIETSREMASPYENVNLEMKTNSNGVDLVFTAKGYNKAEKLVLNNPRRIILDFFFPSNVSIKTNSTANTQRTVEMPTSIQPTQPAEPLTVPETKPVKTPPAVIPEITSKPRRRSPAVTTPPSTITIPTSPSASQRLKKKTVVIDPGHGGKDPGASANGVTEKNVNLAVGLELERALTAKGYNVVMTRRTDVYLKLQERTDIANNVNADLFVSVHVNALPSKKSMTGFEIYIMALPTDKDAMNLAKIENREYVEGKGVDVENVDRRTEMLLRILGDMQQNNKISESTDFASYLYNAGARSGLPMRRVAQAPFFVLRGAGMPAVLLEIGFVTNAAEARTLTTQAYQQKIAQAMASGIVNYLK